VINSYSKNTGILASLLFCALVMLFLPPTLHAQHGHPLVGTWSGYLNQEGREPLRVLFTFSFSVDQVISGAFIAAGKRFPYTTAELDPDTWTITLTAQGQNRAGATLAYQLVGQIENLDSPTQRTIAGTWQEGLDRGDFRIVIN